MTTLRGCEVGGIVTGDPIHRFVIRCGHSELTLHQWDSEPAEAAGAALLRGSQRQGSTPVSGLTQCEHCLRQVSGSLAGKVRSCGLRPLTLTAAKLASSSLLAVPIPRDLRRWQPARPYLGRWSVCNARGLRDSNQPVDPLPLSRA